jgi:dipeptidyl aminopeptidase/acylaminoacyl peptidase
MVKMYSLLMRSAGRYRMSLQTLDGALTSRRHRGAVKLRLFLVVAGLVGVLVSAGQLARATPGAAPNDIEDSLPGWWSSDGTRLAWERTAPSLQHIVTSRVDGSDLYVASFTGLFRGYVPSPLLNPYLLVQNDDATILTIGGRYSGPRAIIDGVDATASPDGTRVAYLRGGTLYVARIDNLPQPAAHPPHPAGTTIATGVTPPATDVVGPAWSHDGTRVAYTSGASIFVVRADGSQPPVRVVEGENPSWSRDDRTIAFEYKNGTAWAIELVAPDGTQERRTLPPSATTDFRFPQFSPTSDTLAFISDRQHARGGATTYQYALYVQYGGSRATAKLLDDVHPYSPPAWSPAGARLAVVAGQECKRWGVYIVPLTAHARRLSNRCRYDGTSRADTIHGSPYFDIVNGLAGDDDLYGFWGDDKILGENGNDTIVGDAGNDVIFGGPGNDVISGGTGNDNIIPGNGHDRVDCGAGNDTVEGAGPLDRISKNCEHVRR